MTGKTKTLSVHILRRRARAEERRIQSLVEELETTSYMGQQLDARLQAQGLPGWMRGVRVEKAGPFQHSVIATEHRGH